MGFLKLHRSEGSPQTSAEVEHKLPVDSHKIDAARAAELTRLSHMPGPGVITASQSQRIQAFAENDVARQEQATLEAGKTAEEVGQAALAGAGIQQEPASVDVQHRLSA